MARQMNESNDNRDALHAHLMTHSRGFPNDDALARMLTTWWFGGSALPVWMGLANDAYQEMLSRHFTQAEWAPPPSAPPLDPEREPERLELRMLLRGHLAGKDRSEAWIADIVAAASLGSDHLWQDLGLWSRVDLTALMRRNFPSLAAKNDRDMKWKKFLYKQLCVQEGIYTCRSPSCEVCADYQACFGPE